MSFYYSDRMAGRSRMDYLAATYGRMGIPALGPMDRIPSLRDDYAYRPYAGGAEPYVRRDFPPQVDDFVSQARSASSSQPVYETRTGYGNFDRFDGGPSQRPGPRRDNRAFNSRPQQQQQQQKRMVLRSANNKDLKDTSPKKVLKRPAAAKAPNQQSLSDYLKQIGSDEPVIGLKHVTEYPSANGTFSYTCEMCKFTGNASKVGDHITSNAHRRNYIAEHKLEEVADKDLAKRAAAIETVHGRGEWSVSKEALGFVKQDKSKFFKKVKKTNDVDMQDLTGDDDVSASGLKKGDVVIDEFTIEDDDPNEPDPETNPKFFVLKQIDKLLDDDFSIANEIEAMVVDSIIRKMDRSLAQFVELANTESGIDEIQLLDKDDTVTMVEAPAEAAKAAAAADAAAAVVAAPTTETAPALAAAVVESVLVDVSGSESLAADKAPVAEQSS